MPVDPSDLDELKRLEATTPGGGSDLSALETIAAVFGFLIANARVDGGDGADECELLARFSGMTAPEVRRIAGVLKALGYAVASQRLAEIAGRRKHGLRPLAS